MNFNNHVNKIKQKVYSLVGALKRCPKIHTKSSTLIYNAHILSKIRPNILIWSQCRESLCKEVQILMNKALKILFNLDWYTPGEILLSLTNSMSLNELIQLERCKFIYKISRNELKTNITLIRFEETHRYPTRNRRNFMIAPSKTNLMLNDVVNASLEEFNKLPKNIKELNNFEKFVKCVKEAIITSRSNTISN